MVLRDGMFSPEKLNRKRTNLILRDIYFSLCTLQECIKKSYEEEPNLYRLLEDEVFTGYVSLDDGRSYAVDTMEVNVSKMEDVLRIHDDDLSVAPKKVLMEDLGYRRDCIGPSSFRFEKELVDNDEQSVVEEVYSYEGNVERRQRTVFWEKTNYGRSSKLIRYKKFRMTKQIAEAFANSLAEHQEKNKK